MLINLNGNIGRDVSYFYHESKNQWYKMEWVTTDASLHLQWDILVEIHTPPVKDRSLPIHRV